MMDHVYHTPLWNPAGIQLRNSSQVLEKNLLQIALHVFHCLCWSLVYCIAFSWAYIFFFFLHKQSSRVVIYSA